MLTFFQGTENDLKTDEKTNFTEQISVKVKGMNFLILYARGYGTELKFWHSLRQDIGRFSLLNYFQRSIGIGQY